MAKGKKNAQSKTAPKRSQKAQVNAREPQMARPNLPGRSERTVSVAPGAYNVAMIQTSARMSKIPGGIRVSHREFLAELPADGVVKRYLAIPSSLSWLKGEAARYENFQIKKWNMMYVPLHTGTTDKASVSMAPVYNADAPVWSLSGLGDKHATIFMSQLPGFRRFAGWVEDGAVWLASKAIRQTFRNFGITKGGSTADGSPNGMQDESKVPGAFLVIGSLPTLDGTVALGELYIEYEIDLISQRPSSLVSLAMYSTSTTSSALALESAEYVGCADLFNWTGNTITFNSPGSYTVVVEQVGTSPVIDTDGHLILDDAGNTVTASRMSPLFDVSANGYIALADSNYGLGVATTTGAMQVMFIRARYGDQLVLDSLTSGTLTATRVFIAEGGVDFGIRA